MENAEIKTWLVITTNINTPIQGVPVFVDACNKDYDVVQHHEIWLPASSDYKELIVKLLNDFSLSDSIAGGIKWDIIKLIGQKLFAVIKNYEDLQAQNIANTVDFQEFTLQFDDIKITFHGLGKGAFSQVSHTFQRIIESLPVLAKSGVTDIIKISLPMSAVETDQGTEYTMSGFNDPANNPHLWHIVYDHGLNEVNYNSATKEILNL